MSTYTDQINLLGSTVWLPAMHSSQAATALRQELETILAEEPLPPTMRESLYRLQGLGWGIIWHISYSGEEEINTYSLSPRANTWASKTLERLEREHKPEALPGVPLDSLVTLVEAAQITGLKRQTILARIQSADNPLPAYRVGRQYMVAREDLAAWRPKRPGPRTAHGAAAE